MEEGSQDTGESKWQRMMAGGDGGQPFVDVSEDDDEDEDEYEELAIDPFADVGAFQDLLDRQSERQALEQMVAAGKGKTAETIDIVPVVAIREEGAGVFTSDSLAITISNAIAPERTPVPSSVLACESGTPTAFELAASAAVAAKLFGLKGANTNGWFFFAKDADPATPAKAAVFQKLTCFRVRGFPSTLPNGSDAGMLYAGSIFVATAFTRANIEAKFRNLSHADSVPRVPPSEVEAWAAATYSIVSIKPGCVFIDHKALAFSDRYDLVVSSSRERPIPFAPPQGLVPYYLTQRATGGDVGGASESRRMETTFWSVDTKDFCHGTGSLPIVP